MDRKGGRAEVSISVKYRNYLIHSSSVVCSEHARLETKHLGLDRQRENVSQL